MNLPALALLVALGPLPQEASTGPVHTGFDPTAVYDHSHEGPLGEKLRFLEESVRCNCGCTLDLHTCQLNMQCGVSPRWSARIREALERGVSEQEILDGFVAEYGKAVLIAPPLEGFNWVGYLAPGVALLMGGILVGLILRRNAHRVRAAQAPQDVSPEEWDRLQAEIRRIEEEEEGGGW